MKPETIDKIRHDASYFFVFGLFSASALVNIYSFLLFAAGLYIYFIERYMIGKKELNKKFNNEV